MSTRPPGLPVWDSEKQEHSTHVAVAILIALLILFLWLHFILAQQSETIGRQMAAATERLNQIERHNQVLLQEITMAESQSNMSAAAQALGFRPQQPLYLAINRPLASDAGRAGDGRSVLFWMLSTGPETVPEIEDGGSAPASEAAPSTSVADLP